MHNANGRHQVMARDYINFSKVGKKYYETTIWTVLTIRHNKPEWDQAMSNGFLLLDNVWHLHYIITTMLSWGKMLDNVLCTIICNVDMLTCGVVNTNTMIHVTYRTRCYISDNCCLHVKAVVILYFSELHKLPKSRTKASWNPIVVTNSVGKDADEDK